MQHYQFTGETPIQSSGRKLRYLSSNGERTGLDDRILLRADNHAIGVLQPGEEVTLPQLATVWEVVPYAAGLVGVVQIGDASISMTHDPGAVPVFDGSLLLTARGVTHLGGIARVGGAALFSAVGIVNTGTKRVAVQSLKVAAAGGDQVTVVVATGAPSVPLITRAMRNKLLSGANSAHCVMYASDSSSGTDIAAAGIVSVGVVASMRAESQAVELIEHAPLILPAGYGFWCVRQTAATALSVVATTEEIDP